MVYNYYFAQGSWENRASLNYTQAGEADASGVRVDAYGHHLNSSAARCEITPPCVHVEELDNAMYIKYAGNNVVIKIEKV